MGMPRRLYEICCTLDGTSSVPVPVRVSCVYWHAWPRHGSSTVFKQGDGRLVIGPDVSKQAGYASRKYSERAQTWQRARHSRVRRAPPIVAAMVDWEEYASEHSTTAHAALSHT